MVDLVFTSELALKRSIKKKYPKLKPEQLEATFNQQKEMVGVDLETFLENKYQEYKNSI